MHFFLLVAAIALAMASRRFLPSERVVAFAALRGPMGLRFARTCIHPRDRPLLEDLRRPERRRKLNRRRVLRDFAR